MPQKLLRCFTQVKASLRDDHDDWSAKRREKVARAICVKRTGLKFDHSDSSIDKLFNVTFSESGSIKKLNFSFSTPYEVVEKADIEKFRPNYQLNDPDSVIVAGRAIFGSTSLNHNEYSEKELKKAVKTLPGIPCQIDHSESARDTFGLVQDGWWDVGVTPAEAAYIAELEGSDPVTGKVVKRYVRGVSVSTDVGYVECSICGEEWSFMHEHWPGETYEGKVCKRRMMDITFRHLGFTAFPAIEGADAQHAADNNSDESPYVPESLTEAIDNAMAFAELEQKEYMKNISDSQTKQVKQPKKSLPINFGETDNMSNDPVKDKQVLEYKLADRDRELEEMKAKLKSTEDNTEAFGKLQEQVKNRLVDDVLDLELQLKKIEEKDVKDRRIELKESTNVILEAKYDVLTDWAKHLPVTESPIAGPRSKVEFGTQAPRIDERTQNHLIRESKLEQLHLGLFGSLPSISSVKTVRQWDPVRQRWDTSLSEMFRRTPKKT